MGGSAANGSWNLFNWDYGIGKTWGGIIGGAIQGAVDGLSIAYGASLFTGTTIWGGKSLTMLGKVTRGSSFAFSAGKALNTGISMFADFDNAMDIMRGNYYYDESRTFGGQILQSINRSTGERLQQFIGYNASQGRNIGGDVNQVNYYWGATLVNLKYGDKNRGAKHSGMTLGIRSV